jgi:hypothetical protein
LQEEKKLVGEYLNKVGFNQEHKIQELFNFEHYDPTDLDGGNKVFNSRLPISLEAMEMYIDGIHQKDISLF